MKPILKQPPLIVSSLTVLLLSCELKKEHRELDREAKAPVPDVLNKTD